MSSRLPSDPVAERSTDARFTDLTCVPAMYVNVAPIAGNSGEDFTSVSLAASLLPKRAGGGSNHALRQHGVFETEAGTPQ